MKQVEERAKESEAALEEALKSSNSNLEGADREELAKLTIARLQAPGTKVQVLFSPVTNAYSFKVHFTLRLNSSQLKILNNDS